MAPRTPVRARLGRVVFAPEIMLTPGEAVLAFVALGTGPLGTAALVLYLLRRTERDRHRERPD